jgi:NitT/TauT family transport system substrate-binding protein
MRRKAFVRAGAMLAPMFAVPAAYASAQSDKLTTIRFISSPSDDLRPILYAQSAGLFKRAGLDVVLQLSSSGAVVAQSVVGGAMDIGKASITAAIAAHARGIPFVLIAPSMLYRKGHSTSGIIVATDSPLRIARDLQGKVIAARELGDIGYLGLRALVDAQGGDSASLRWVEVPTPGVSAAIEQGRVDAGLTVEPFMTQSIRTGKVRLLVDMLEGFPRPILESVFFATQDYVAKNRDVVARFTKVVQDAAQYCNTHETETIPLFIALSGMDSRLANQMHHSFTALSFDASQIQPVIDLAAKYAVIRQSFDAHELVDPSAART